MKLQYKIDQHDIIFQEKAELEDLGKSKLSMDVTILEHDDISHYSISDHEPKLKMLRYKEEDNETKISFYQQLNMTFYK